MKLAAPQLPAVLDPSTVAAMVQDGELENAHLADEDAVNTNCAALELRGVKIDRVQFMSAHFERINARDVIVMQSDFSGTSLSNGDCNRVTFTNCRMTGFDANKASLHDVIFRGCKLDLANFRFSDLRRVQFIDCTLAETDFLSATLRDVSFQNCILERTVFEKIKVQKLDLRTSQLSEVAGWQSLKGALIDNVQLSAVAPYLAHALGLIVRDD